MDCGVRSHDRHDQLPIWLRGSGDDEAVEWSGDFELVFAFGGDEFVGAEFGGLVFLSVGPGEHDYVAAHFGGELDCQVA